MESSNEGEYGYFGWREFQRNRRDLLSEFDRAKEYNASRPVRTEHGNAGEAALRKWLSDYLPARYGVTSGYVIPDIVVTDYKLYHFDVIVYDAMNSPVLWMDANYDTADQGRKRAIPAKHVCAVLEVKAALSRDTAEKAIGKLSQMNSLRDHLPTKFSCATVFFELDPKLVNDHGILFALLNAASVNGCFGGVVLRCELDPTMIGRIELTARPANPGAAKNVLIPLAKSLDTIGVHRDQAGNPVITDQGAGVACFASPAGWCFSKIYGPSVYSDQCGLYLHWSHNAFAQFALDLLERVEGIPKTGRRTYTFGQVFDRI